MNNRINVNPGSQSPVSALGARFAARPRGLQALITVLAGVALAAATPASAGHQVPLNPMVLLAAEADISAPPATPNAELLVYASSAGELLDRFGRLGYSYDAVVEGGETVPRVRVLSVPADIADMASVDDRKALFFKILLPLVLRENDRIVAQRREIQILQALTGGETERLTPDQRTRLEALAAQYRVDDFDFDALLLRVDMIPPSLALAQAAIESGWGSSRFAQEGNALFGQITTSSDSLVARRSDGDSPRYFAAFGDIANATASYMRNLNSHPAYRDMRHLRASLRQSGDPITGIALSEGLLRYSERGADYVAFVQDMIRMNDLHLADSARLSVRTQLVESRQ